MVARYPEVAHHLKPVTLLRYERMCKQLLGIGAKQKVKDAMRDVKEEVRLAPDTHTLVPAW